MGKSKDPTKLVGFEECFKASAILRPVMVGSKELFQRMNSFIDGHGIKPIIAQRTFRFKEARKAYEYMEEQKFFGKIVIRVSD